MDEPYGTLFSPSAFLYWTFIKERSFIKHYYLIKIHKTTIVAEIITLTIPITIVFSFVFESEEGYFLRIQLTMIEREAIVNQIKDQCQISFSSLSYSTSIFHELRITTDAKTDKTSDTKTDISYRIVISNLSPRNTQYSLTV